MEMVIVHNQMSPERSQNKQHDHNKNWHDSWPPHSVPKGPTSVSVGALTHGSGLDGNDPLPRHVSRDYYIRNGRPSLVLGDDHSHMGGSDDMKSGVMTVEIVLSW